MGWVRQTLRRSMLIVLGGASVASCLLLLLSPTLLHWWVGHRIHPPFLLLLGLAIWTVISCCGDALAMFINGAEGIPVQVVVASCFGIGCITAKIFLVHHVGIIGIPWATIVAYLLLNALPNAIYAPYLLRRLGTGKEFQPDAGTMKAKNRPRCRKG
jgi:hypothetical protein